MFSDIYLTSSPKNDKKMTKKSLTYWAEIHHSSTVHSNPNIFFKNQKFHSTYAQIQNVKWFESLEVSEIGVNKTWKIYEVSVKMYIQKSPGTVLESFVKTFYSEKLWLFKVCSDLVRADWSRTYSIFPKIFGDSWFDSYWEKVRGQDRFVKKKYPPLYLDHSN